MWSVLAELASASPWLVLSLLFFPAAMLFASFALCIRGTSAGERPAIIRAFAELVRSVRGNRR